MSEREKEIDNLIEAIKNKREEKSLVKENNKCYKASKLTINVLETKYQNKKESKISSISSNTTADS